MFIFLAAALPVLGQQFVEQPDILLPDSIVSLSASAIDLDNDGLPDLALLVKTSEGRTYLMHVAGDTIQSMGLSTNAVELPSFNSHLWYDYNYDNQLDLVLSPDAEDHARVFLNQGEFVFAPVIISIPRFNLIHFADLDADGKNECVVSRSEGGSYLTQTFRSVSPSEWRLEHDTLKALLTSVTSVDMNNDGFKDLYISGREVQTDSVFSRILFYNEERFEKVIDKNFETQASIADVNHDGVMDVVAFGKTSKGKPGHFIFHGGDNDIEVVELSDDWNSMQSLRADFDSDGKVDEISLKMTSTDTINVLKLYNGNSETLIHKQLRQQVVSDFEHDGDLDVIQVLRGNRYSLRYLSNATENRNLAPQGPKRGIGFPIYNHQFFYWEKATDDHTFQNSLTYDFYLESADEQIPCEFDLVLGKRLSASHGNNGVSNFRLVRNISAQAFNYAIQSVDNALHGGPGGVCIGSGSACVQIAEELTSICTDERLKLQAPSPAHWFSLAKGHLDDGPSLDIPMTSDDTVFYIVPDYQGCTKVGVFPVKVGNIARLESENMTVCEGTVVDLNAPGDWSTVSWNSESAGPLGSGSSIQINANVDDTFVATFEKSESCTYEKEFQIRVSKPVLVVQPASAKIAPGGTVTLSATGANSFQWSPSESLSNAQRPSTVASPLVTTKYTVTGYDSINCEGTAEVTVFVEAGAGFVPSLFTPNADGTNDELKVYGLNDVNDFTWKIYNREGNVVFSTRSVSEAAGRGWDGTANGVRQPNGVYFWKVEGSRRNGELLLNGKKEGSFLLIR